MSMEDTSNKLAFVIDKAMGDESFRKALLADSNAVLKAEGLELPEGCAIKFVENTPTNIHIVLPPGGGGELSDEQLDFAGGYSWSDLKGDAKKLIKAMIDARQKNPHFRPQPW